MYDINVSNGSNCELFLYDDNGNSLPPIRPNSNFNVDFPICRDQTSTLYVGPSTNISEACFSKSLNCDDGPIAPPLDGLRSGLIDQVETWKPQVTPNPFTDQLQIQCFSEKVDNYQLTLYNLGGQAVRTISGTLTKGDNQINVNELGGLPANMYFCRLEHVGQSFYTKLVKQ